MDDASHRSASAVIDVGHGASYGSRCGYASENRRSDVGYALADKFCIRVVVVANDTVGNSSRQQRLDGSQHGNGDCRSHKTLNGFPRQLWHYGTWQLTGDAETVAYGLDGADTTIVLQQ